MQVVGNVGVLVFNAAANCTEDQAHYTGFLLAYLGMVFGISILSTNLLSHRYFLDKAKGMCRVYVVPTFDVSMFL